MDLALISTQASHEILGSDRFGRDGQGLQGRNTLSNGINENRSDPPYPSILVKIQKTLPMGGNSSLTERLRLFTQGDATAVDALLREILPKLQEIAARELKRERYITPLSRTELIHEVWLSSLSKGGWQIRDRGHFFALASLAMRRILVDLARKRLTQRRGGGTAVLSLDGMSRPLETSPEDAARIIEIDILMDRLEVKDPDAARMVDMHYFSGFTLEEIAEATGLTFRQVRSRWERGLKNLKRMLSAK